MNAYLIVLLQHLSDSSLESGGGVLNMGTKRAANLSFVSDKVGSDSSEHYKGLWGIILFLCGGIFCILSMWQLFFLIIKRQHDMPHIITKKRCVWFFFCGVVVSVCFLFCVLCVCVVCVSRLVSLSLHRAVNILVYAHFSFFFFPFLWTIELNSIIIEFTTMMMIQFTMSFTI